MNRMIKLFQQKSDNAYEKYLSIRMKGIHLALTDPLRTDSLVEASKWLAIYDTWDKAADLLRKEELNAKL